MAARHDEPSHLEGLVNLALLLAIAGLILHQGAELRKEIRALRGEMRIEFGNLRGEIRGRGVDSAGLRGEMRGLRSDVRGLRDTVGRLEVKVANLEVTVDYLQIAVARIEARDSLRLRLGERFTASGEGASYGGPRVAADLLVARALPEIDSVRSTLDEDAQIELAENLWVDRANILARANPIP